MYCNSTFDFPWILLKLRGESFCISSETIERMVPPSTIYPLPDGPSYLMGIMYLDELPRTVLGLREMLGMGSLREDLESFSQMRRKHIEWVEQLRRSAASGAKFTLPTDPHACAFGQWYDHYHTDDNLLRFLLTQVESPHSRLHRCAAELEAAQQAGDSRAVEEKLAQASRICHQELLPLLARLVEAYRDKNSGLVLMLNGGRPGLFVDEVSGLLYAAQDDGLYTPLPGKPDRLIRGVRTFEGGRLVYPEIDPAFLPLLSGG